jgi:hypothetical protein
MPGTVRSTESVVASSCLAALRMAHFGLPAVQGLHRQRMPKDTMESRRGHTGQQASPTGRGMRHRRQEPPGKA